MTVIVRVMVGLTFLFGLGNVATLVIHRSVPRRPYSLFDRANWWWPAPRSAARQRR